VASAEPTTDERSERVLILSSRFTANGAESSRWGYAEVRILMNAEMRAGKQSPLSVF
jgi:hypothetical protein